MYLLHVHYEPVIVSGIICLRNLLCPATLKGRHYRHHFQTRNWDSFQIRNVPKISQMGARIRARVGPQGFLAPLTYSAHIYRVLAMCQEWLGSNAHFPRLFQAGLREVGFMLRNQCSAHCLALRQRLCSTFSTFPSEISAPSWDLQQCHSATPWTTMLWQGFLEPMPIIAGTTLNSSYEWELENLTSTCCPTHTLLTHQAK